MKTYVIGGDSVLIIKPETLPLPESNTFYYDNAPAEIISAPDCKFPIHIVVKSKSSDKNAIDIVLNHKGQVAGLSEIFGEYLHYPSDDDNVPERPKISLFSPESDFINYYCPVCNRDLESYRIFKKCPTCGKTIDWGKGKPKIKKTLYWEEDEEDMDE